MRSDRESETQVIGLSQYTPLPDAQEATPTSLLLEKTFGSQLPPSPPGGSSLDDKEMWRSFWNNKTCRKQFHKASDCIKKVKTVESKIKFLSQCIKLEVVPKTFRIKVKVSENFSEEGQRKCSNTCFQSSLVHIQTARSEARVSLAKLCESACAAEQSLHLYTPSNLRLQALVSDKLSEKGRSFLKQADNTHKQRLRNLLVEQGKQVPEHLNLSSYSSIAETSNCSSASSRKFESRHRRKRKNKQKSRTKISLCSNYSSVKLSEDQESVLNLGLNFCPMRKHVNRTDVEVSCKRYIRSCRWREFWQDKPTEIDTGHADDSEVPSIFKDSTIKTNLPRNHPCPPRLQQHFNAVHGALVGAKVNHHQSNLTSKQWESIKELKNLQKSREIVIKANDKTGGVSILDCSQYVSVMNSKLLETFIDKDNNVKPKYVEVNEQLLKRNLEIVKNLVEEGRSLNYISEKDSRIMVPKEARPGRMYGLVKNHKPVDVVTGIPPLREVVSCSGSSTEFISAYVDHHLKPEVRKLNSFIEDTPDFLREIERRNGTESLPANAIPVSMDVVALYPNVPWNEGLKALEQAANKRSDQTIPTEFLSRLMVTVLGTNIFEFDSHLYLQKYGTAIGTRAAPTFANLFMGWWEEELQKRWTGTELCFYRRFIDDLFFIWTGDQQELHDFIQFANNIFPTIKVTADFDYSTRSVNYLDMRVWIDDEGAIRTDLHRKENQKITYLLPSSAHPRHICSNIPYSLAYRLLRLCWSKELLEKRLGELEDTLVERGYRRRSVQDAINKVKNKNRIEALEKVNREREKAERVRFVIKYDPRLPDIPSILQQQYSVLVEDQKMKEVFPEKPMICYQRVQNLGEILTKAKLPPKSVCARPRRVKQNGFHPCGLAKCPVCELLPDRKVITTIKCTWSGEVFPIKNVITCSSRNVVYCITCTRGGRVCPLHPQYIGETGQQVKERLREHRGTVIQPAQADTTAPVGMHFRQPSHTYSNLQIIPFEKILSEDPMVRKVRESFWINKFNTVHKGLNKKSC